MIRDLTDDQVRAVLAAYEEMGGVAFGSLGAAVSPREDLKMLVGMASMEGRDPEALLRMLIERARRAVQELLEEMGDEGMHLAEEMPS